jgi:hypothetical protein
VALDLTQVCAIVTIADISMKQACASIPFSPMVQFKQNDTILMEDYNWCYKYCNENLNNLF